MNPQPLAAPARFTCTVANPWNPSLGTSGNGWRGVEHPDSTYEGDRDFGDGECCARYKCNVCGHAYYVELSQ